MVDRGQEIQKYCPLQQPIRSQENLGYRPLMHKNINKLQYFVKEFVNVKNGKKKCFGRQSIQQIVKRFPSGFAQTDNKVISVLLSGMSVANSTSAQDRYSAVKMRVKQQSYSYCNKLLCTTLLYTALHYTTVHLTIHYVALHCPTPTLLSVLCCTIYCTTVYHVYCIVRIVVQWCHVHYLHTVQLRHRSSDPSLNFHNNRPVPKINWAMIRSEMEAYEATKWEGVNMLVEWFD